MGWGSGERRRDVREGRGRGGEAGAGVEGEGEEGEEAQKILQSNSCSLSSIGRTWGDQKVRRTPTKRNIIVERWTGGGGQGKEAGTWGIRKTEGGSCVNLFVKGINAHGEGGEKEGWRQGMEGREHLFETFTPHDESILHQIRFSC